VAYSTIDFVKNVLRDEFLSYPSDISAELGFAQAEINSRLAGTYHLPFDDTAQYAEVPVLIQWITAYLVGYKLYDSATATLELDNSRGKEWWEMAQRWLSGIVEGDYLLHLADGTVVPGIGSTTGPRSYPSGVREKAPSTDNIPYFTREQAGNW
jgi:hypothetical protein